VNRLSGKVAIVTGAGSRAEGIGNGRATAILFAREGAKLLLTDHDSTAVNRTLELIREEGFDAEVFVGDATSDSDSKMMVEIALDRFGRIDILDNNVGIEGAGTVVEVSEQDWDKVMDVNVKSMFLASKHVIPHMERQGAGSIINISSISSVRPRGLTPYTASKGAVNALTQAMAIDHGSKGIRVNAIMPGPVFTPNVFANGMTDERRERRRLASPLELEGTGWDVAQAAVFLASDEARWITGVILPVDGGVSLASPPR
jgi:NAD(P)-dependent dehydrogenase (short-subunit alcohol dehydrogenase family)